MKHLLVTLWYCTYIRFSSSLPVEEAPGFTPWPLGKRAIRELSADEYSGPLGDPRIPESHFGIKDPTCRKKLPGDGCWDMEQFTVNKLNAARKQQANDELNCGTKCLFYTQHLSGAAERIGGFVLWDQLLLGAAEESSDRTNFQTIWELHDKKYYPDGDNLDATPEVKCAFQDFEKTDRDTRTNGCQRLYFMSMSKAMASQCKGEVFLLTTTDLKGEKDVPEDGIWWQVEFPTLIDPNRPADKKVDKITYLQVDALTDAQFEEKKNTPKDKRMAPTWKHQGEYWPSEEGMGKKQLKKLGGTKRSINSAGSGEDLHPKRSNIVEDRIAHERDGSASGLVERAPDGSDSGESDVCNEDDECYNYPYPIEKIYEMYKDIVF